MIFTTFYFSGTKNTKWAVDTLCQTLAEKEQQSAVYSVESPWEDMRKLVRESDAIGFAFPVYGMNVPDIMGRFLGHAGTLFPPSGRKPVFIIVTGGYADGCGPKEAMRKLAAKGAALQGYVFLKIANNAVTSEKRGAALSPEKLRSRLAKCKRKLDRLADALIAGTKKIEPGVYRMVVCRDSMNALVKGAYRHLGVDTAICSRCMACVENCPTQSITLADGAFAFQSTCTSCLRCFNFCPTHAVLYNGKRVDPHTSPRWQGPEAALTAGK